MTAAKHEKGKRKSAMILNCIIGPTVAGHHFGRVGLQRANGNQLVRMLPRWLTHSRTSRLFFQAGSRPASRGGPTEVPPSFSAQFPRRGSYPPSLTMIMIAVGGCAHSRARRIELAKLSIIRRLPSLYVYEQVMMSGIFPASPSAKVLWSRPPSCFCSLLHHRWRGMAYRAFTCNIE